MRSGPVPKSVEGKVNARKRGKKRGKRYWMYVLLVLLKQKVDYTFLAEAFSKPNVLSPGQVFLRSVKA